MSEEAGDMKVDAARAKTLTATYQAVVERVSGVAKGRNVKHPSSSESAHVLWEPGYLVIVETVDPG